MTVVDHMTINLINKDLSTNLLSNLPLHVNITCIQVTTNLYATAPSASCIAPLF